MAYTQIKHKDILETAKDRFRLAEQAETDIRKEAVEDLRFRAGQQWPDQIKQERDQDQRPCLTINRIPQFIRQVTNDQRQNRPAIRVSPVDDDADIETAKVFQGIIRHIEYNSDAEVAYDRAFEGAATHGLGYFRIITDYVNPMSFEQEVLIKSIRNPFSVFMDPNYQEPDASDAGYCFIVEDMPKEDYKREFAKSEMAMLDAADFEAVGVDYPGWAEDDTIRIAEYYYKEFKQTKIYLLQINEVSPEGQPVQRTETMLEDDLPEVLPEGVQIVAKRDTVIPVVKWCKLNAVEVLEETEWAGSYIPVIPVLGDELEVDGKRILEGIVRHSRDSQKMYNFMSSAEAEAIALAPRAPFIGAEGQFEGHEGAWASANRRNHAYLEYKPVNLNGKPAQPPQRNAFEPATQAITQSRMLSADDLKATTGIYDASLGNKSNENSGVAIQRRNQQSQTSNFHYIDNLTRALRHAGRILLEIIPKVYDTERAVRIMGEDGEPEIIRINQMFERKGETVNYQLGVGKYDVTVDTGPNYQTKRQEAAESMHEMTKAVPQIGEVASDLMIKAMDWPYAQEVSERLKRTIPPEIIGDEGAEKIPPQVQAQMKQMSQMVEQLTEQLNAAQEQIQKDLHKQQHEMRLKQMEIDSDERINVQEMQTKLEIERAKMESAEGITALKEELADLRSREQYLRSQEAKAQQQPTGGPSPGQPMEPQ